MKNEAGGRLVRTIRLDDEQVCRILEKLDEPGESGAANRTAPRYRHRIKALVVHIQQPGCALPAPYLVPTRDISEGGLGFLHGGFVHPGSRCLVQLITTYGTWNNVMGTVVRCRYVQTSVHEVGLMFDESIDPTAYCTDAVHSRVLLAEDDPFMARLATFHLEQLNAQVDYAENGRITVEKAMKGAYDLILLDLEMPVMNGFEAAAELRRRGYTGAIVAVTALTQPSDRKRCLEAGCNQFCPKPFQRNDLAMLLHTLREEPLFSSFHDDNSMAELVESFVGELPRRCHEIENAIVSGDAETLEQKMRSLKAEGSSYGFDIISELAASIESAILGGACVQGIREDAERLVKLCHQARSPNRSRDEGNDRKENRTSPTRS